MMATQNREDALPFDLAGRRVLIYSLGLEGRDLARFMLARGAAVTISDTRGEAQLAAAGAAAPEGVERVVSGQDLLDPAGFDLVAVSQSVLRYNPALIRARELGIPFTSQMRLFLQLCRGRVIGITGSSGKSTTTALVAAMASEAGIRFVSGGNIGTESILGRLDEIDAGTTVILEISHTQLQYTDRSPAIAAITNVTPNHLDQFSWDEYVGLKRNILHYQQAGDSAILNADDPTSRPLMAAVKGRLVRTSIDGEVPGDGAWLEDSRVLVRAGRLAHALCDQEAIRLRGRHNLSNVVMAAAIGAEAGFPREAMQRAIASFHGVPHRLEVAGTALGATWVNDSIATSPERAMAGLNAFTEPVILLLGGREKNLPLDGLQQLARTRCRAVICFGEARNAFAEALRAVVPNTRVVETLEDAVGAAAGAVRPGDVVLLSPAGTSFDAYPSFEVRGEHFRALVRALPGFSPEVPP
ncbi:MAG: UDP-N-acetylmuramoyl-L-alanine--D-glutamate ligase [Anaerolinea sp.]|nr:UDP-N-acetylmuramoyl-L-alanine--D-glutamate ligase [Anaerolinea sp.]